MYHGSDTTQSRYVSTDANLFYNRSTPACTVIETVIRIAYLSLNEDRCAYKNKKRKGKKKINFR